MTAYASQTLETASGLLQCTIKSVNFKNLRLQVYADCSAELDRDIRKKIQEVITRGSVEIKIELASEQAQNKNFKSWIEECEKDDLPKPTWSDYFFKIKSDVKSETQLDVENEAVMKVLSVTLSSFIECAEQEAIELLKYFQEHIQFLKTTVDQVKGLLPNIQKRKVEQFKERIKKYCAELDSSEKESIAQECAVLLEKLDVQEEVERLDAHFNAWEKQVSEDWKGGKYCDFLCQEINREINTLGTKSVDVTVSSHCASMKTELEKIREQVQNLA